MIKKFDLNQAKNSVFLSILTNIKGYLREENAEELHIVQVKSEFEADVEHFTSVFKNSERGSKYTKTLVSIGKERDIALVGLIKHINLFTKFPEVEKKEAGISLQLIIKKYGKTPHRLPNTEKTGVIIGLLKELEEVELKQKISLIGATAWVNELKNKNEAFTILEKERIAENASIEVGATKTAKTKAYETFKKLVKSINALSFVHGEEKYKRLANKINEELEKVK